MTESVFDILNKIKKEKRTNIRNDTLKKIYSDGDLDYALEIAKHESTLNLTGSMLITALVSIMFSAFVNLLPKGALKTVSAFIFLIIYFAVLVYLLKVEFKPWTDLYYDLIELKRKNKDKSDISKLDTAASEVELINSRLDVFEKKYVTYL